MADYTDFSAPPIQSAPMQGATQQQDYTDFSASPGTTSPPTPTPQAPPPQQQQPTQQPQQIAQAPQGEPPLIGTPMHPAGSVPQFPIFMPPKREPVSMMKDLQGGIRQFQEPYSEGETTLAEPYRPLKGTLPEQAQALVHNQAESFKNLYRGAIAMPGAGIRELTNFLEASQVPSSGYLPIGGPSSYVPPPSPPLTPEQQAHKDLAAEDVINDTKRGIETVGSTLPMFLPGPAGVLGTTAVLYGKNIAHAAGMFHDTPAQKALALKDIENRWITDPIGEAINFLPLAGPGARLLGKGTKGGARLVGKLAAGTPVAEHVSQALAAAREKMGHVFSPAVIARVAEEAAASQSFIRKMTREIDTAYKRIDPRKRPFVTAALERTDPRYAGLINDPAVRDYANTVDKYWRQLWQEMEQRKWVNQIDKLSVTTWPEVASKAYRGELELPALDNGKPVNRNELTTLVLHENRGIQEFVREYARQHPPGPGSYVPLVHHATLRTHFQGATQAHIFSGPETMTKDEIDAFKEETLYRREKAKPQERVGKDTDGQPVTSMRGPEQSMNAGKAHVYKFQVTATALSFARQLDNLMGEVRKLPPQQQAKASLKLLKKYAPALRDAGVAPHDIVALQDLAHMAGDVKENLDGIARDIANKRILGDGLAKLSDSVNAFVKRATVVLNGVFVPKILATSAVLMALNSKSDVRSMFHTLLALRIVQDERAAEKISKEFLLPSVESNSRNAVLAALDDYAGLAHKGTNYFARAWVAAQLMGDVSALKRSGQRASVQALLGLFSQRQAIRDFLHGVRALEGGIQKGELLEPGPIQKKLLDAQKKRYRLGKYNRDLLRSAGVKTLEDVPAAAHAAGVTAQKKARDLLRKVEKLKGADANWERRILKMIEKAGFAKPEEEISNTHLFPKESKGGARLKQRERFKVAINRLVKLAQLPPDEQPVAKAMLKKLEKAKQNPNTIQKLRAESNSLMSGKKRVYKSTPLPDIKGNHEAPSGYVGRKLVGYATRKAPGGLYGRSLTDWNKRAESLANSVHNWAGRYGQPLPPIARDVQGLSLWLWMHVHSATALWELLKHHPERVVALNQMAKQTEAQHQEHGKERGLKSYQLHAGAWDTDMSRPAHRLMLDYNSGWNLMADTVRYAAAISHVLNPEKPAPGEYGERETEDIIGDPSPILDAVLTLANPYNRGVRNPYVVTIGADANGNGGKDYDTLKLARRVLQPDGTVQWRNPDGSYKINAKLDAVDNPWDNPAFPYPDTNKALVALKRQIPHSSTLTYWQELADGFEHSAKTIPFVPGMAYPKIDNDLGTLAPAPPLTPAIIPGLNQIFPTMARGQSDRSAKIQHYLERSQFHHGRKQMSDDYKLRQAVMRTIRALKSDPKAAALLPKY